MKTKLFLFICTLASMFVITSCSKSDDNETISVQESPLTKIGITNPVKSCKAYIGDELYYSNSYIYTNNFLQSCSSSLLNRSMTLNYSTFSINGKEHFFQGNGDLSSFTFSNIILNNQGFVSSMTVQGDDISPCNMTFEYNSDGYLTKWTMNLSEIFNFSRNITYTYNEDNDLCKLKAIDYLTQSGKKYQIDYFDLTCSYNDNAVLNSGIYLFYIYALPIIGSFDWGFMYSGLFGKPSKHIPDEITGTAGDSIDLYEYDVDNESVDVNLKSVCTKNSKGQITSIKLTFQSDTDETEIDTFEY